MRYVLSTHAQGSPEWKADRAGKATGSRAADILATIKTGEAASRRDYRTQLVIERLIGAPAESGFINKEMMWGTEQEPFARMAYEAVTGNVVQEAGFAYLPDLPAGCSVDGFMDGGGLLEIKCPKSSTHIEYLRGKVPPPAYVPQMLHNMWVTGQPFADFVSFDPRLPPKLQLFVVRFTPTPEAITAHETAVFKFLREVADLEAELRALEGAP